MPNVPCDPPAGQAKHNTHSRGCMDSTGGGGCEYIIHMHLTEHTPGHTRACAHTCIQIQPLYHTSDRAEESDIPVDARLFSALSSHSLGLPGVFSSSCIFMWMQIFAKGLSVCSCERCEMDWTQFHRQEVCDIHGIV